MPRSYGVTSAAPYASAPAVGLAGDTYYNTAEKVLYLSDGTTWNTSTTTVGAGAASYKWNTATASADPGSGRVAINNAAAASATQVYASVYDQSGQVIRLDAITTGDTFVIYQTGTLSASVKYTVASAPTNNGPNQWFTIPVTYVSTGSAGFSPNNNVSVLMQDVAVPTGATPITAATDFNACTTTGLYSIANSATNGTPNATSGAIGILQVLAVDATHVTQVFYEGANVNNPLIHSRSCNAGSWCSWELVLGRLPVISGFNGVGTNGVWHITGTAAGGPGVTGAGIMTSYGSPLGVGGLQGNTVQVWTSYVTGEIWQRQNSAGAGFTAWKRLFPLVVSTDANNDLALGSDNNPYTTIRGREIGYGFNNTNVTNITTTGIRICGTASIAFKAGRKYRITASWRGIFSTVLNDLMTMYITIGGVAGTNVRECVVQNMSTSSGNGGGTLVARYAPGSDVTNTADLCAVRTVGTGTCQVIGASAAGQLQEIVVEDMGP